MGHRSGRIAAAVALAVGLVMATGCRRGGSDPDEPGCWRVTSRYAGSSLSYVYERR
jgi:hypothetical protein